MLLLINIISSK